MKDFIKVGLDFVRGHPDGDQLKLNFRFEKYVEENDIEILTSSKKM